MLLLFTPRVLDHVTPAGHPESPERGDVMRAAALRAGDLGITVREPRAATDEEILRVHDADYLAAIAGDARACHRPRRGYVHVA